ncbi:MAG: pyridoxamine 5'-phosphate oxidase family protein [Candidatus Saccharibacteria bacterium]|nr:pyridoxamine 5'-phosphate oxidase family protein [Candidatus Saccharibacteria bacterium]
MATRHNISDAFKVASLMQVATSAELQPWVCTVYFVADDDFSLYWLSWPERRHSREIAKNDKVAIAIAVKHDQPVIGIQAEGRAEVVRDGKIVEEILPKYVKKYGAGKDFIERFKAGDNEHQLYKFTPSKIVLFDEKNNPPEKARQEMEL